MYLHKQKALGISHYLIELATFHVCLSPLANLCRFTTLRNLVAWVWLALRQRVQPPSCLYHVASDLMAIKKKTQ